MILFAFTTLLGNLFYVDKSINHIAGKVPRKTVKNIYYIIASLVIFIGAGLSADFLWNVADVTMGAMTIINIPVLFILSKYAYKALNDYLKQRKQGVEPVFKAKNIGLTNETDYWN